MSRSRIRSSTLRDLADGYGQSFGNPAPEQNVQKDKFTIPQQYGPENIRSQSLTNNQMVDRVRYVDVPLRNCTVITTDAAIPTFTTGSGLVNSYPAWKMAGGKQSSLFFGWTKPIDFVDGTIVNLWISMVVLPGGAVGAAIKFDCYYSEVPLLGDLSAVAATLSSGTWGAGNPANYAVIEMVGGSWTGSVANPYSSFVIRRNNTTTAPWGIVGIRIGYTADM